MATTFQTRLSLKIDSLTNWKTNGEKYLLKGEVGFVTTAASMGTRKDANGNNVALTEPVVMMIVGEGGKDEGGRTINELLANMSFYARSSDVLEVCKSEEALVDFITKNSSAVTGFVTAGEFSNFKNTLEQWQTETRDLISANKTQIDDILEDAPATRNTLKKLSDAIDAEASAREEAIANAKDELNGTIADVKTTANNAQTAAKGAQSTADSAVTAAANAQTTANAAKDAASKNAEDIVSLTGTVSTNTNNIASNTKAIADLKTAIGNVTNIMNFRGAVASKDDITDPVEGDVICVNAGTENGKEFVYSSGEWVEIGDVTAQDSAISKLQERVGTIESNYSTTSDLSGAKLELEGKISSAQSEVQNNLNALTQTVSDNETDIENKVTKLTTRVSTNETNIGTANTNIANNTSAIAGLKTQVSDLKLDDINPNTEYVIFNCGSSSVNI